MSTGQLSAMDTVASSVFSLVVPVAFGVGVLVLISMLTRN